MTRRFDLSSPERQGRHDVPIEVLERLDREAQAAGITLLVIGAAARDLVIHALLDQPPHRATRDVDIAVATNSLEDHRVFLSSLSTAASSAHRVTVFGVTVDVVPFGAVEQSGQVRFEDDHLLDVTGLQEADAHADHVVVEPGLEVRVAPLEALATLKLLAWRTAEQTAPRTPSTFGRSSMQAARVRTRISAGLTSTPWTRPTATSSWRVHTGSAG